MTPADLRAARKAMGRTQGEMAEALGLSIDKYGDLERGVRRRYDAELEAIPRTVELAVLALQAGLS